MSALENLPNARRGMQTPGAGGVDAPDAGVARTGGDTATQSGGPARFVSTLESRRIGWPTFTCAYWDYLRRITPDEPLAENYGLAEVDAEVIRRQCNINFNQQVFARGLAINRAFHAGKGAK